MYPNCYAQFETKKKEKDRIVQVDNSMENPVTYSCRDSIYFSMDSSRVTLFGEAQIVNDGITMTADLIEFDTKKNEVFCIYTLDDDGNRVGIPKFEEGAESFTAATIRYNFETEKGYIKELKTTQDELHLHMGTAKRHANDQVHFVNGKITTCDLDDPHFHFNLSRAVMVPEKRMATGPMNLWVKGIPTPIGMPFSSLPLKDQEEKETGGLIFPQMAPASPFGAGFQDLGYYFPLKTTDLVHTTFYASLYTQGTFEIRNFTEYMKRYKHQGSLNLSFASFKQPFPDSTRTGKSVVQWNHRQEQKANPYWNFNSKVNFQSDNNGQTNLDPLNDQHFQNAFNSDINLTRNFPTLPLTIGLKAGLKQNSVNNNMDFDLPSFTLNANRFFPFKALRKDAVGKEKFYEKIAVTYSMDARNRGVVHDSLLQADDKDWRLIQDQFLNGAKQQTRVTTAIPILNKTITLSPSIVHNARLNMQQIRKNYDESAVLQSIDTLNRVGLSQDVSMVMDLSTNLYAYYRFIWDKDMKMRHVITPSLVFRYAPNTSSFIEQEFPDSDIQSISYSPYENSLFREPAGRDIGEVRYNIRNTFELKRRARKDTLEEFERIKLIDQFNISGAYDMYDTVFSFSPIRMTANMTPITGFSINLSSVFSIYSWDENTGQNITEFAFDNNQGLGRFTEARFAATYTFAPKESQEKVQENQQDMSTHWEADFQYFAMNPHELIDFRIPWKVNLQYNLFYNLNTSPAQYMQRAYRETQNIQLSGDFTITKRWKLAVTSNFDITSSQITQARISLNRDMHCWQLGFFWTPVSGQQSFLVRFNATSSLFEAAKVELQKPPDFL